MIFCRVLECFFGFIGFSMVFVGFSSFFGDLVGNF